MQHLAIHARSIDQPMVFVPVEPEGGPLPYPERFRDAVMVDAIHDGDSLPEDYLVDRDGAPISLARLLPCYVRERDWGASLVAERLARSLRLGGYHRVVVARCLLDFGRFPGTTRKNPHHLRRFAINYPFSELLDFEHRRRLLEEHYDRISTAMEAAVAGKLLKIAVHTYDPHNPSGTLRPEVSLISRPLGYQLDSEMPHGVFDPIYPDALAEHTCDRILQDRISLHLGKAGVPVSQNHPYLLPEGSPEVRHQVWSFFRWLQARFERAHPESVDDPAYALVWEMLQDTNLRSADAETLRSTIHMFRRPPRGRVRLFRRAEAGYRAVADFLRRDGGTVLDEYRSSGERPMALGIEVRKDLVWELDDHGRPVRLRPERALRAADLVGEAIARYLVDDRRVAGQLRVGFRGPPPIITADSDSTDARPL